VIQAFAGRCAPAPVPPGKHEHAVEAESTMPPDAALHFMDGVNPVHESNTSDERSRSAVNYREIKQASLSIQAEMNPVREM